MIDFEPDKIHYRVRNEPGGEWVPTRDVAEFVTFTNLKDHSALRTVARAHVIAWRKDMESRGLAPTSIRRKLSALSSLFDYLCERNAVARQSGGRRQAAGRQ